MRDKAEITRFTRLPGITMEPNDLVEAYDAVNAYIDPQIQRHHSYGFGARLVLDDAAFETLFYLVSGSVSDDHVRALVFTQLLPSIYEEGFALVEHLGNADSLRIYPVLLTGEKWSGIRPSSVKCDDALRAILEELRRHYYFPQ